MNILKFRSFVSKEQEGFVFIFNNQIPEIIFEDILYQLFEPIFEDSLCPEAHYFSTTDQILQYKDLYKAKDYIYVHFLRRVKQYEQCYDIYGKQKKQWKISRKFKLGDLEAISKGIEFQENDLYIISEQYYGLYNKEIFRDKLYSKILEIPNKYILKQKMYADYMRELEKIKKNDEFKELKNEIQNANQEVTERIATMEMMASRYIKAKTTLKAVLRSAGIEIRGIKDLY